MAGKGGGRAEAERWLLIAEKLLAGRDLQGSKTFAMRARESDPRLDRSDRILAVVDTLLAGDARINGQHRDWYAVLQLVRLTQDPRLISTQYARLGSLLSPAANSLPFADQAFRLVLDAFSLLSNPTRKAIYDQDLPLLPPQPQSQPQPQSPPPQRQSKPQASLPQRQSKPQPPPPQPQPQSTPQPPVRRSPRSVAAKNFEKPLVESTPNSAEESEAPSFWTTCPYCFHIYEYPKVYEDCSLRCQNCRRAFHAAAVPAPPGIGAGKDSYFCCWGFFPLGFSPSEGAGKKVNAGSNWAPFTAMFACPSPPNGGPNVEGTVNSRLPELNKTVPKRGNANAGKTRVARILIDEDDDDDDALYDVSEPSEDSDDDWDGKDRKRKKTKTPKGRGSGGGRSVKGRKGGQGASGVAEVKPSDGVISGTEFVMQEGVGSTNMVQRETSKKVAATSKRTGKPAKDLGKLDLNVEFSNEVEEPAAAMSGTGLRNGDDDGIEGIEFFEGLDEFLSSLPILSVVGDEKVKTAQ